ncbi:hypothetical protein PHSC3_001473 [Chlamydiales bacterium STE3]|nr:hypothetical protein PHSC3_001473 [Chlamydiales bacterium STE3]
MSFDKMLGKRPFDEVFPSPQISAQPLPFAKRERKNSCLGALPGANLHVEGVKAKESRSFFEKLPTELVEHIITFLNAKSLLSFEATSKGNRKLTEHAWKLLRRKNEFSFDLKMAKNSPRKNYILEKTFIKYILEISGRLLNPEFSTEIFSRYSLPRQKFPGFASFINKDLSIRELSQSFPLSPIVHKKIFEGAKEGFPGETLLQGWIYSQTTSNSDLIQFYFEKAIEFGATCASRLALRLMPQEAEHIEQRVIDLAIRAAEKKDYGALEELTEDDLSLVRSLHEAGKVFPPVLLGIAINQAELRGKASAALFAQQALAAYGDNVTYFALNASAEIFFNVDDQKALLAYTKMFGMFRESMDSVDFLRLLHLAEKEKNYQLGIKAYIDLIEDQDCAGLEEHLKAATCYYFLNMDDELEKIYSTHLLSNETLHDQPKYGKHFLFAAINKARLKKWGEAEHLFDTYLLPNQVANEVCRVYNPFALAAMTKIQLNKHEEAEKLYDQAFSLEEDAYNNPNNLQHIQWAALVKLQLGKRSEANALHKKLLNLLGHM